MSARRRKQGATKSAAKRRTAGVEFWGRQPNDDDLDVDDIVPAPDPSAMVRSLGSAPLPSREHVAGHYFTSVYEKSAGLATALAAAADLLPTDDGND
ncbi:MAG TPA: hypothetical protein VGO03_04525 [Acidimicrobiia bacterium]|jgi:hypothetical protein